MKSFENRNDSAAHETAVALVEAGLRVMRIVRAEVRRRKPDGLSVSRVRALAYLRWQPGAALADVSAYLGLGASTTSKLVEDLVSSGYVEREVDAADRRRLVLRLTPAGVRKMEVVLAGAYRRVAALLAPLSASEREAVWRAMRLVIPLVGSSSWSGAEEGAALGHADGEDSGRAGSGCDGAGGGDSGGAGGR